MIDAASVAPMTEFVRNPRTMVQRIVERQEPLGLTVNGKVKLVLVDVSTFEEMWAAREKEFLLEAIREGERDIEEGLHRPARDVIREIRARYGL